MSAGDSSTKGRPALKAAAAALVAGLGVLGLKFYAYSVSGSSALLSDALESIINVVAGSFALFSVWVASRPPDDDHPYGHGKMEFFSAGFEGALVVIAAIGVFLAGAQQMLNPLALRSLDRGIAISVLAGFGNLAIGIFLTRYGRKLNSAALTADGKHLLTDVYTTAGVAVGLILVELTGAWRLDGAVACVMGCNILFIGFQMVRSSFLGLMDASDPTILERICALLSERRKESWIDIHRLRAWRSGARIHVDFHLILPGDLPLEEAHKEVKDIEQALAHGLGGPTEVLIHLDPCSTLECPICVKSSCDFRAEGVVQPKEWNRESAILDTTGDPPAKGPKHDRSINDNGET